MPLLKTPLPVVFFFDLAITALVLAGQFFVYRRAQPWLRRRLGRWSRTAELALAGVLVAAVAISFLNSEGRFWGPTSISRTVSFGVGIWIAGSAGAFVLLKLISRLEKRRARRTGRAEGETRRDFLWSLGRAGAVAVPFGVAAYGTLIVRANFQLRETDFPVPNLPPDLEGVRLALLSDIHLGPYLSLPELDRVIAMANEARPHVTLVTGDLITRTGDPLETCLERLTRLRADAGVLGCLGNHEIYAECQDFAEKRARSLGIEFLRARRRTLEFGSARLNIAGVDYQRQRKRYLVGAGRLVEPGAVNLLLSHNPDVFPVAADLGYDLVVGGHTHGGQVTVEIVEQTANVGRFFTPYVAGLYRRGRSALYVSRGIGTINLPMRLGAKPEVALLRLRRA